MRKLASHGTDSIIHMLSSSTHEHLSTPFSRQEFIVFTQGCFSKIPKKEKSLPAHFPLVLTHRQ